MKINGHICVLFIVTFVYIVNGNIVLQSASHCGSNSKPKEERVEDLTPFTVYSHIGKDYYYAARDCVVVIIGKVYHQWEVKLQNIDIDGHKCRDQEPCCNDYLKIFNAFTVDNARLFPSIPWRGICGNDVPRDTVFTSTQNYITIQFNVDHLADNKRGFQLKLQQIPRKNAGSELYKTGFFGGWNDGTLNELQIDWKEQEQIPGDYKPGKDEPFEFDPNGISCYSCADCKRDYFKGSDYGVSVEKGCYVCTKEWLQGSAKAVRNCLSRSMYQNKLLSLRDISTGTGVTTDFRSCKVFTRTSLTVSATYINVCICESGNCNHAALLKPGFAAGVLVLCCCIAALSRRWLL